MDAEGGGVIRATLKSRWMTAKMTVKWWRRDLGLWFHTRFFCPNMNNIHSEKGRLCCLDCGQVFRANNFEPWPDDIKPSDLAAFLTELNKENK